MFWGSVDVAASADVSVGVAVVVAFVVDFCVAFLLFCFLFSCVFCCSVLALALALALLAFYMAKSELWDSFNGQLRRREAAKAPAFLSLFFPYS